MMIIISPTIISLREGIEAVLIVAIMLSYLRKTNQTDLRKYVVGGTIVAIVSSLGVAIVVGLLWGIFEGPMLSIFEGSVVLFGMLVPKYLKRLRSLWRCRSFSGVVSDLHSSVSHSS
jgi:high-affinity iron transporter